MIQPWWRPVLEGLLCLVSGLATAAADSPARVTGDRVNVRSRPGFVGELMTRLNKDQEVRVQGLVVLSRPAANEPARWSRIALPEGTPVWVRAGLVATDSQLITAEVVDVRAGPSAQHAAVGRLVRGTRVTALGAVKDGWLEVASLPGCSGYTPETDLTAIPAVTSPVPAPALSRRPPPPAAAAAKAAPATEPVVTPGPSRPLATDASAPVVVAASEPIAGPPEVEFGPAPPKVTGPSDFEARQVRREGVVIRATNIQAPSKYALQARDSRRTIDFLLTTRDEPIDWKAYHGRVVVVIGREYLDRRSFWKGIPLLDVETVESVR